MAKISVEPWNDFCTQSLFLYGTWREDGTPNFGLFCWLSYAWIDGEKGPGLGVMACIGEDKLTKDLIRKNGCFSANIVTEELLPLADYYGTTSGRNVPDKMKRLPTVTRGQVLDVPVIGESPVALELKVLREINLAEHSDLFLCEMVGVEVEEALTDKGVPVPQRLRQVRPVVTCGEESYFSLDGRFLGNWGGPRGQLKDE